jgi:hypothetical protein
METLYGRYDRMIDGTNISTAENQLLATHAEKFGQDPSSSLREEAP